MTAADDFAWRWKPTGFAVRTRGMKRLALSLAFALVIATLSVGLTARAGVASSDPAAGAAPPSRPPAASRTAYAVFAGGCFWCAESDFEHMPGVLSVVSGYTGGPEANPTYDQVSGETTGHVEAVQVAYDPGRITYRALVDRFWRTIDPTDPDGQFCDRGPSYRTAVFVASPEQRAQALASRTAAQSALGRSIVTPVRTLGRFWPAEAYHQDFYLKNPLRYRIYREGCGRDRRLRAVWGAR